MIRVHVTVSENSIPYYEYLVSNFKRLSSGANELIFYAHCLDLKSFRILSDGQMADKLIEVYKHPQFFVTQNFKDYLWQIATYIGIYRPMKGSNGHAAGLNSSFAIAGGEGIDIISDSDIVMLMKDWDVWVTDLLTEYGIIGTSYEPIGGKSSGFGLVQTYKNKPTLTWCALASRYDWKDIDTSPEKSSNIKIDSSELSDLYNLPVGYELVRDVGWKIPGFLCGKSIPYLALAQVKSDSPLSFIKTGENYHEEYQFNGVPVLAHQRGSHQHSFRQSVISSSFYDACDSYLSAKF